MNDTLKSGFVVEKQKAKNAERAQMQRVIVLVIMNVSLLEKKASGTVPDRLSWASNVNKNPY